MDFWDPEPHTKNHISLRGPCMGRQPLSEQVRARLTDGHVLPAPRVYPPGAMTAPPGELVAYHIGIVVGNLQAVADRYQRVLGVDRWRMREVATVRMPWDARSTDGRLNVAFGRAAGLTFELLQPLDGRTPHMDFLEKHGDGVQHIGFWTPDVRAVVDNAVKEGGRITLARLDPNGNAEVQLSPGASMEAIVGMLPTDMIAYVDPGMGGVQLEFIGPAGAAGLREWLGADFDTLLQPPPPW